MILLILLQISCTTKSNQERIREKKTNVKPQNIINNSSEFNTDLSEYYTDLDTININTDRVTLVYNKAYYNNIIDKHPEFFEVHFQNPELSYQLNYDFENFGSQVGKDDYFVLYTHFLKKKNGEKKWRKERNNLIDIYTHINSIFQRLQYGGTYFGHQYYRILGFAEYSLYLMPKNRNELNKTYNISKQKSLYIKSLRQLIKDESSIDYETIGDGNKLDRIREMNSTIDNLEDLISDIFYLRRAQEFQYKQYEYY